MITYKNFRPTTFDSHISLDEVESWLVLPCGRNRDSECLDESNFYTALQMLGGEGDDVQVHRFGHWGHGWFEIIIARPDTQAAKVAQEIEDSLEGYPVLSDDDFSRREWEAAGETWKNCYNNAQRVEYIRENRDQFHFHSFSDMVGCVKGRFYCGEVSEMLGN